ncbi:MAG TPA: hypothetical protein VGN57_16690 [Pirellulaceae bacterium]|jgi:hypothetical protein|nr:hypothetical protein [Pirellulaceae bacterium]
MLLAAGCGKIGLPQSEPASTDATSAEGPEKVERPPVPESVAATRPDETRPTTPEAFVEEFKRRFDEDFYSAFVELAYWDATSEDHRRDYVTAVQGLATHPVTGTVGRLEPEIVVADATGYESAWFPKEGDEEVEVYPPPKYILGVSILFGDGALKQTDYFAIGEHEGKLYFSTVKPD